MVKRRKRITIDVDSWRPPSRRLWYTPRQVSILTSINERSLRAHWLWYEGKADQPAFTPRYMRAHNLNTKSGAASWVIYEDEFVRWLKFHGVNPDKTMKFPRRGRLYTVNEVADILERSSWAIRASLLYYEGKPNQEPYTRKKLLALNINRTGNIDPPKARWRVAEEELVRWQRDVGVDIYPK